MVTFAPKRNARYTSSIPFPTLLSFLPLPSASVRMVFRACADVIIKFSRIHRFPIFFANGALLRAWLARSAAKIYSMPLDLCSLHMEVKKVNIILVFYCCEHNPSYTSMLHELFRAKRYAKRLEKANLSFCRARIISRVRLGFGHK